MFFPPWQLAIAYGLDLILGDPPFLPHPIRWIGHFISWAETNLYPQGSSPGLQRVAGFFFWLVVMTGVGSATLLLMLVGSHLHTVLGQVLSIWLAYATLATRSLHRESSRVVEALRDKNLVLARQQLARIVGRDTQHLGEEEIMRALLETISENDDDIILLDEEDEEIVIDDVDKDSIIIDEEEKAPRAKSKAKEQDDDFLIIEEDEK